MMDWFARLTGFEETTYNETRAKLTVEGSRLTSHANGKSYAIGKFELPSLQELRDHIAGLKTVPSGHSTVRVVKGDVRTMHAAPANRGALFQVASQFNALEMTGPSITPEEGVTGYILDKTQGPACAIAAGAATIYRNYFVPVGGSVGQTATRQIDTLADVGQALSSGLGRPVDTLWTMTNGYAMCGWEGLDAIAAYLAHLSPGELDAMRGQLRIAVQSDVEVTDIGPPGPLVSQAFCSALPVAYTSIDAEWWRPFASLVLDAAYEATLLAAVLNAARGASNLVLLTQLGGGAFGNEESVILSAMRRAIDAVKDHGLDIRIVSYGTPPRSLRALVAR